LAQAAQQRSSACGHLRRRAQAAQAAPPMARAWGTLAILAAGAAGAAAYDCPAGYGGVEQCQEANFDGCDSDAVALAAPSGACPSAGAHLGTFDHRQYGSGRAYAGCGLEEQSWSGGYGCCNCWKLKAGASTALSFVSAGACQPDPHCSFENDQCKCCYNGGCDVEDACRCAAAPTPAPPEPCQPDPHCSFEGDQCKCCFNGGCDVEEACRCAAAPTPAPPEPCQPDPHCSFEGDQCKCCFNGGCDVEEACRCAAAPTPAPPEPCQPDPHCWLEGGECKCCYNGGCDVEDACRCASRREPSFQLRGREASR